MAVHKKGSRAGPADALSGDQDRTGGKGMELCQGRFRRDIRERLFPERAVDHWNRLYTLSKGKGASGESSWLYDFVLGSPGRAGSWTQSLRIPSKSRNSMTL